jgi:hypothetical protein
MIIYTHYSDSHKEMYENFFKPSLRKIYSKEEVLIKAVYHKQTTSSGSFMSNGWHESMDIKLDVILTALNETEKFIFADCDIQFFKPFVSQVLESLEDYDIACQEDRGSLCAGFFGCRSNDKTKELFTTIKNKFREMVNDQVALNNLKNIVSSTLLNKEQFYTIGNFFENKNGTFVWDNETNITPPSNILLHHANYVVGVENKLKLLNMIKINEGLV